MSTKLIIQWIGYKKVDKLPPFNLNLWGSRFLFSPSFFKSQCGYRCWNISVFPSNKNKSGTYLIFIYLYLLEFNTSSGGSLDNLFMNNDVVLPFSLFLSFPIPGECRLIQNDIWLWLLLNISCFIYSFGKAFWITFMIQLEEYLYLVYFPKIWIGFIIKWFSYWNMKYFF
jgi:hypothetical protein